MKNQYNLLTEIERIFKGVPIVCLLNKADIKDEYDNYSNFSDILEKLDNKLFISAAEGTGIDEIVNILEKVEKREKHTEDEPI